jgi:hypothetical protein
MLRPVFRMLIAALLTVFAFNVSTEAAQKKTVRHRPRHSKRVAVGRGGAAVKEKAAPAPRKARPAPSKPTPAPKRKPSTKPR